ncbi:MAG: hypothetical protein DRP09_15515 [Candidatus Thorarchaeota archaeon]|nr:MAG: hypothetical protein DRP09_15515 [Candidatus Thorarchaeota archaeon]
MRVYKICMLWAMCLLIGVSAFAGNKKLTDLPTIPDVSDEDLLYIVDDPSGTPTSCKVTVGTLLGSSSPGGSDEQVQYNDGGSFNGAEIYWDDLNNQLSINTTAHLADFYLYNSNSSRHSLFKITSSEGYFDVIADGSTNQVALQITTFDIADDTLFGIGKYGDSKLRFRVKGNGTLNWSDGSVDYDVNLYRYGANQLATDGTFLVNSNLKTKQFNGVVVVDGINYTQDESGIESAISDAGTNGVVYLPPGTYDIDGDGISVWADGITIVGDRGAILRLSNDNAYHNIFNIGADFVTLKGFTIDGNKDNQSTSTYYGVKVLDGADYFTADSLYIKNTYDRGINIQGNHFQVINCRLEGCGQGYPTSYTGAIVFQDAESGVIANNEISNSPSGIVGLGDSQGITISGNCISNITCDQAAGIYCNDVDGLAITGNALYDFSTTEHGVNGIFVAENDNDHLKTTISGNYLYGITGVGIELQSGWCIVSNNVIRLTNGGLGTSTDQHGIYIAGGTENIIIEGNYIYYSHRDGISIGYNNGNVHDVVISGNVIDYSAESGINFDFSSGTISRVTIVGNFIKNSSEYGIEKTNAGTLSSIRIYGNTFSNNSSGDIDTDITYSGHCRYITLLPSAGVLDDNSPPSLEVKESSGTGTCRYTVANFDASTDEVMYFTFVVPDNLSDGNWLLDFYWYADATSGDCVWEASVSATTPGDADTLEEQATDTSNTATGSVDTNEAKRLVKTTLTLSNLDNVSAGDIVTIRINRDADNANDTLTADATLVSVRVVVPCQ